MSFVDPTQARRELARRELAQESLIDFCAYVDPDAAWPGAEDAFVQNRYRARHLRLIAQYIEMAMSGDLWLGVPGTGKKVLLITTPPGHWKSSLVSRKFPAWFVGHQTLHKWPHQLILTSYNAALAEGNNTKVIDTIAENALYRNVFPQVVPSKREWSAQKWSLAEDTAFTTCRAAGVGGGLTGYHARVAVVDDPIKSRKDANSPTFISTLWDWWNDELRTRLLDEDSFILGIWTRWSENDPAGKILTAKQNGQNEDQVVLLRLPALAETHKERVSAGKMGLPIDKADPLGRKAGEALWPEVESAGQHEATRKSIPATFDSLYQGRPRPAGGFIAGREQFQILTSKPRKHVKWVWGTDWAITEKESAPKGNADPDYTVAALVGLWTPNGDKKDSRLIIARIARGQHKTRKAKNMIKKVCSSYKCPIYGGQAHIETIVFDDLRYDSQLIDYRLKVLKPSQMPGDKVTRAKTWLEDRLEAGQVYVLQGPWNEDFFDEVEKFPHGAHDDQIDAISVAVHALGLGQRSKQVQSATVRGFGY